MGIIYRSIYPLTYEQNGVIETRHKRIVEKGLALLSYSGVLKFFWSYAFSTSVFLLNRLQSLVLNGKSPYKAFYLKFLDYKSFRISGAQYFPCVRAYNKNKMQDRSLSCVFFVYASKHKGYVCLDLVTKLVYSSCHIVFNECLFPFLSTNSSSSIVSSTLVWLLIPSCSSMSSSVSPLLLVSLSHVASSCPPNVPSSPILSGVSTPCTLVPSSPVLPNVSTPCSIFLGFPLPALPSYVLKCDV